MEDSEYSEMGMNSGTGSSFTEGTVFTRGHIVCWDPYTKFKIIPNTEGYPVIRQCNLDTLTKEEEFEVEVRKQTLQCKPSSEKNKFVVSEADVRYNCCPVYLKGTDLVLGIYFCNNIRSQGYCYVNVQEFVSNDLVKMSQLPLRSLIEFSRDFVFIEFLSEGSSVYQCRKTKKFVKKEHSLAATFQPIDGTCRVRFLYVDDKDYVEIETYSQEELERRLHVYPSQYVHMVGCIVCDFYSNNSEGNNEETKKGGDNTTTTTTVFKEQKEYVSYFPSGEKLLFRKKIKKEILSEWK